MTPLIKKSALTASLLGREKNCTKSSSLESKLRRLQESQSESFQKKKFRWVKANGGAKLARSSTL